MRSPLKFGCENGLVVYDILNIVHNVKSKSLLSPEILAHRHYRNLKNRPGYLFHEVELSGFLERQKSKRAKSWGIFLRMPGST